MPLSVPCSCGLTLQVKPEHAGKPLRCPACRQPVQVPGGPPAAPPRRPPPAPVMPPPPPPAAFAPPPAASHEGLDEPPPRSLSTGMILGLALGGIVLFGLVVGGGLFAWWFVSAPATGPEPVVERPRATVIPDDPPEPVKVEPKKPEPKKEEPAEAPPVTPRVLTGEQLYRRTLRSTAWIIQAGREGGIGTGSGSMIDRDEGLVLTNHHVVAANSTAIVFFPSYEGRSVVTSPRQYADRIKELGIRARVVFSDPTRDLALLKLERIPDSVPALPIARASASPGEKLHSVGSSGVKANLEGTLWRYSTGEVRQVYEDTIRYGNGQTVKAWIVETQSPINEGDSGGPVVDGKGNLVAVVSGYDPRKRSVSLFIDVREVRAVVEKHYSTLGKTWKDSAPLEIIDADQLPRLMKDLDSPTPAVVARAVQALGGLAGEAKPAVPALLRVWEKAGEPLAGQVAAALERIGPPEPGDADPLLAALSGKLVAMRLYAARSLGKLGDRVPGGLAALQAGCKDSNIDVKHACLLALVGHAGSSKDAVLTTLVKALEDREPKARLAAASALRQLPKEARQEAFGALVTATGDDDKKVADEAEAGLLTLGPPAESEGPLLVRSLKHKSPRVRFYAALSLSLLKTKAREALDDLAGLTSDGDVRVRMAGLEALRQLGPEARPALSSIQKALGDSDVRVRVIAADALGAHGKQPGVYPALLGALDDREARVRQVAETAIKRLGGPVKSDAPQIIKALEHEQALVRAHAAEAVGGLGADGKDSVGRLRKLLEDKSLRVRIGAANALGNLGILAREAVPDLVTALGAKVPASDEPDLARASGERIFRELIRSSALVVGESRFRIGHGSAWVVDTANKLLVTNHHVVAGSTQLTVYFPEVEKGELQSTLAYYIRNDRRLRVPAVVVLSDPRRDLALVRVTRLPPGATAVPLASKSAQPGQELHSVGNSGLNLRAREGNLWRYTNGKARQVYDRTFSFTSGQTVSARLLETQAPLNPGDSGGAVVNDRAELVGVVSALDTRSRLVSLCIDVSEVRVFLALAEKTASFRLAAGTGGLSALSLTQSGYRKAVATALGKIGVEDVKPALPALRLALRDPDPQVRMAVAGAVAQMGGGAAPLAVDLLLLCKDAETHGSAEEALVKLGADVVPTLAKQLETRDRALALAIIRVLARMGPTAKRAASALKWCRVEYRRDREVSLAVTEALRLITAGE